MGVRRFPEGGLARGCCRPPLARAVGDIPRDWSPSHAQSRPLQQGPCRLRSHPSQLMVSVLFLIFSSVFKKIFCQGEPLGHGRLALGCRRPLCGAGRSCAGRQSGGLRRFPRGSFPLVSPRPVPGLQGDGGLPLQAWGQGQGHLTWHPKLCLDTDPPWEFPGDPALVGQW